MGFPCTYSSDCLFPLQRGSRPIQFPCRKRRQFQFTICLKSSIRDENTDRHKEGNEKRKENRGKVSQKLELRLFRSISFYVQLSNCKLTLR